jgi:hypothetical protein
VSIIASKQVRAVLRSGRALLQEWPRMPAPVIAERIGRPYSMPPLRKRLALIRPQYVRGP